MHQLADSMLDIIQRIEDRFELLVERNRMQQAPPANNDSVAVEKRFGLLPSREGCVERRSEFNSLKKSNSSQDAGQATEPAQASLRGLESSAQLQIPALEKKNSGQEKFPTLATKSHLPDVSANTSEWISAGFGGVFEAGAKSPQSPWDTDMLIDFSKKIWTIDKKLEQIAVSMGVRGVSSEGDEEEDRKRLKEKLKQAIEADRRSRVRTIVSRAEVWLEYIFGICRPDQRLGKRGSR